MQSTDAKNQTLLENTATNYHLKYYAHELTKRCSSDSIDKLAASLADAQVDLNPHQIDAALFAFRSPLSKGAILADEVGLGKTIEAGILLAQKWAQKTRKLLIIVPANLRKQWHQELAEKFFLNATILETKSFNSFINQGNLNPFEQNEIVICSYQFAKTKGIYIKKINWDLVIIDEAHRLRNVYKPGNQIAKAVKECVANAPKVLLTATPLQNSLLELFGLVSIIDDYTFGDLSSFKSQFINLRNENDYAALRNRLKPVCQRTLRRQVLEYVRYTNRIPITQEFVPSSDEAKLYELVSTYLQRENLYALPASQRKLMTLILRKLLASSSFAISNTLGKLAQRLQDISDSQNQTENTLEETIAEDYEIYDELADELADETDEDNVKTKGKRVLTEQEHLELKKEMKNLLEFKDLADTIVKNSKGEALFEALNKGFEKAKSIGAMPKAIIFTESRCTQNYIKQVLEKNNYFGKIVLFNGSNNDNESVQIYRNWLEKHKGTDLITGSKSADMRAALVEYFREEASIMIATEAASEGINLQFCSLVVNYDLPWNPQRIEQRIGRCHRYGQKFDVVVVNFLNKNNAADQRVYELLRDKFRLFDGVFGASDEVLGNIESGVDFSTRIAQIYQSCRTRAEIDESFNKLQQEMEEQINERMNDTRQKLLENFDEEVQEKLRIRQLDSNAALGRYETWLWLITRSYLKDYAVFNDNQMSFTLNSNPFVSLNIHSGPYKIGKNVDDANLYRLGHPLAQAIIEDCKAKKLPKAHIKFKYSRTGRNIALIDGIKSLTGWLTVRWLSVKAFDTQDFIVFSAISDDGIQLSQDECSRLFTLAGEVLDIDENQLNNETANILKSQFNNSKKTIQDELNKKNGIYFEQELDKLDMWAEDQRNSFKITLKELEDRIKGLKRSARLAGSLSQKLELRKESRRLEINLNEAWKDYDNARREIDIKKDALIDQVEKQMQQVITEEELFTIRWSVE